MDSIDVEIIKSKDIEINEDTNEDTYEMTSKSPSLNKLRSDFMNLMKLKSMYVIFKDINDLHYFTDDEVSDYILFGQTLVSLYESKEKAFKDNIKELYTKIEDTDGVITPDEICELIESIGIENE